MNTTHRVCMDCTHEVPVDDGTFTVDGCFVCDACSLAEMSRDVVCVTCGDTGEWTSTTEQSPTVPVSLGKCPDCNKEVR